MQQQKPKKDVKWGDFMLFGKKYGGAIGYFKLDKFWSKLSEKERKIIRNASNQGISLIISTKRKKIPDNEIDKGKFSVPFKIDERNKEILLNTPIDYFSGILGNLVHSNNKGEVQLFIKWYKYLTKKFPKVNDQWSLYFFHMHAMEAYKKLKDMSKAVEAAEKNLIIAEKLSRKIKKDHLRNPCYEFLHYYWSKKEPNETKLKWLKKVGKKCGWKR